MLWRVTFGAPAPFSIALATRILRFPGGGRGKVPFFDLFLTSSTISHDRLEVKKGDFSCFSGPIDLFLEASIGVVSEG